MNSKIAALLGASFVTTAILLVGEAGTSQAVESKGTRAEGLAGELGYTKEQVARGSLLVGVGACNDCHTPWKYDEEIGSIRQVDMPYLRFLR